jgi:hypothetical protein
MNNDTGWNSNYLMISGGLVKQGNIRVLLGSSKSREMAT